MLIQENRRPINDVIRLTDISVAYDENLVLEDVNTSISKSAMVGIIGPNGAGKSTLLKVILGLLKPMTGQISFDIATETSQKKARKHIAYVPQNGSVNWEFPATVTDIVLMGRYGHLGWFKHPKKIDYEIANSMIAKVGMQGFEKRHIDELSGGQQQRVFLARALAQEADVYLLDEPFKGVDVKTEKTIVSILRYMQQMGKTIVVVHHALHTVKQYFNEVILVNKSIVAQGPVHIAFTEENVRRTFYPELEELLAQQQDISGDSQSLYGVGA